jgi:hypothetical protein
MAAILHGVPRATFDVDILIWVASREDVIRSKRAAGRTIDLEDARLLEAGEADLT